MNGTKNMIEPYQNHHGNLDILAQRVLEAEHAVLGAILLENDLIYETVLTPEHFMTTRNQIIFRTMRELAEEGTPIDIVTMTMKLDGNLENVGGVSFLTDLAGSVPSTANFAYYQNLVLEEYKKRKMSDAARAFLSNPSEEQAERIYQTFVEIQEIGQSKEKSKQEVLYEIYNEMIEDKGELTGIDTGFKDLNLMTGGLNGGDLIVIAARPSMGKTAFALNLAMQCCTRGGVADIFSLEMPEKQLTQRMLSAISWVEGSKWRNPYRMFSDKDRDKATKAIGVYDKWNMYIHDESKQTVADIRAAVRKTKRENPGKQHIVVIDYLQLITPLGKFERNDLAIGSITRELKQMARQFEVPVVLLSQLNRGVEQRQDKRPMMSDLRDSGSIEQDADIVMMLYRDDYYNRDSENKNIVEINIVKHRNGPVGNIELLFHKECSRFQNLERRLEEPQ